MAARAQDWKRFRAAGGLLMASLLAGCGGGGNGSARPSPDSSTKSSIPPVVAAAESAATPVNRDLVAADNTFGLSLLATLLQGSPGKNVAISPVSVAMCLQIAYNGAQGTTQPAMAQALQLGSLPLSQLNNDNAALLAALLNPGPQVTLTVANSLWVRQGPDSVAPTFVSMDQTYYGATIGDLAGAPADVNEWVSTQTHGEITRMLPPDMDLSQAVAILANVVHFKGSWQSAFDPQQTATAPFTLADGTQAAVQMMRQDQAYLPYLHGQNFQAVNLPYGQGRLSMLIVLPSAGLDLGDFVGSLTPADIDGWVSQLSSDEPIDLQLPRFTATYNQPLQTALSTLGMGVAFQPDVGNLSGIYPNAYLSALQHATVVQVDETGTVASGATIGTVSTTAIVVPIAMQVNRPFLYAIRDNQTGALLFAGVMMNPNGG